MRIQWRHPQAGLWVALDEGRPAGIVSRKARRAYRATVVTGRSLGLFESVEDAQAALERAHSADPARAPHPISEPALVD
ncbi:hypothetical protein [Herbiconiux solani]|uniref:hypothetical protein n=1 Tax=Herbiconiux solani TaxID=661329 RepID=UPI00082564BC|nr:hypothetical protein [Herbiconiux solani]